MAPAVIKDAGYQLRELSPSVGASVGTATHAAVAYAMTEKVHGRALPPDSLAEECGITELGNRIRDEGVQWDGVTPNLNTGQKQVRRQYRIYRITLADELKPTSIEKRITVPTKRGNELSGQIDLFDTGIRDLKTGTTSRSNIAQYGGYSLLKRAEGGSVNHIIEDFVQRVPIDKEQPRPVPIDYDIALAERVAGNVIADIEDRYQRFRDSGDNMIFNANPNSVLCGDKFCAAYGTTWCEEWKR
jgi:hypothetical protein